MNYMQLHEFFLNCFSSTLVLDKKLVHVVYSKLSRDVLVIAMPAERCVTHFAINTMYD